MSVTLAVPAPGSSVRPRSWWPILVGYGLLAGVFWWFALPQYTATHRVLAIVLTVIATLPFVLRPKEGASLPIIEIVAAQYAIYYALPLFSQKSLRLVTLGAVVPPDGTITEALWLAILALLGCLSGFFLASRLFNWRVRWTEFRVSPDRAFWYGVVVVLWIWVPVRLPDALNRPVQIALSYPVGLTILAGLYWGTELAPRRRRAIQLLFALSLFFGVLTGGTAITAVPIISWLLVRWVVGRKTPYVGFALLGVLFLVMQPVKLLYRGALTRGGAEAQTLTSRLNLLKDLGSAYWTLASVDNETLTEETQRAGSDRLALLLVTAHVVNLTPTQLPYVGGETISYLGISWIPRFLWPEKPTAQLANTRLPVMYGTQDAGRLSGAMFVVGQVAEVYANFGAFAIFPVFLLVGMIYRVPIAFLQRAPPLVGIAILMGLMFEMCVVETTLAQNFGGFLQQLLLQLVLLRFLTGTRSSRTETPGVVPNVVVAG